MREAIQKDEAEFQARKADPLDWLEVLRDLDVLSPGRFLSDRVICHYLLGVWWAIRFEERGFIYLPFLVVHLASTSINIGRIASPGFEGTFAYMYRAVAPYTKHRRACFLLLRNSLALSSHQRSVALTNPNHFFAVAFDYRTHKAYIFGTVSTEQAVVDVETGEGGSWDCWLGPELWRAMGEDMGWKEDVGDPNTVEVVTKNWKQVRSTLNLNHNRNTNPDLHLSLDRMELTAECIRWRSWRS